MMENPKSSHTLGVYKAENSIQLAQLSLKRGRPCLLELTEVAITRNNVNPLYTENKQQHISSLTKKNLVVSLLSPKDVLSRPLEIPLTKKKDLQTALPFEAEPHLPYPAEEALLDYFPRARNKKNTQLTFFAAKRQHLEGHLHLWNELKINPEVVSSTAIALTNFSSLYIKEESSPYFALYLSSTEITIVVVSNQKPQAIHSCYPSPKSPIINELIKLSLVVKKQLAPPFPKKVFICGELGLEFDALEASFPKEEYTLVYPKPDNPLTAPKELLMKNALAIGAALGSLSNDFTQINFRQKEFAYPAPWKRYKRPLGLYLTLALLSATCFWGLGNALLLKQENLLRSDYASLLSAIGKPHSLVEEEFNKGHPPKHLETLSPEEIVSRTHHLSKSAAPPPLFPLQPNTPLVTDVLAWLKTHPALSNTNEKTEYVKLENFSYSMVKRPEKNKKQEKYQVKVELEFTSPSPKLARSFHDSLIVPNLFVDPKGEVKWSSNRGKYRTSFILQDKTRYSQKGSKNI